MKRHLLIVGVTCSVVACSLTTDLNGLSNGAGTAAEGGATIDGGAIDGDAGDASKKDGSVAGARCADRSPAPFFCADFDDSRAINEIFAGGIVNGLGDGVRDSIAKSPPSSLLIKASKPDGTCGYLEYQKDLTGPSSVSLETWIRLGDTSGAYPDDGAFASATQRSPSGVTLCTHILRTDSVGSVTKIQVQHEAKNDLYDLSHRIVPGNWTLLRFELTNASSNGSTRAVITVDGESAFDREVPFCGPVGRTTVRIGLYCEAQSNRELRFDNDVMAQR